jgi:hypothetical protein
MVKPEFKMRRFSPLKTRVKKPKTKGTKADSVEKVTVAELLPSLENTRGLKRMRNRLGRLVCRQRKKSVGADLRAPALVRMSI